MTFPLLARAASVDSGVTGETSSVEFAVFSSTIPDVGGIPIFAICVMPKFYSESGHKDRRFPVLANIFKLD